MVAAALGRVAAWIASTRAEVDAPLPAADDAGAAPVDLVDGARQDADSLAFTRMLLEAVASASDPFAAALGLRAASHEMPASLPVKDRLAVRAGGIASLGLPWAVLPVARRWLRDRVAHLVLAARLPGEDDPQARRLDAALRAQRQRGIVPQVALGGELVLGPEGAAREIERLMRLARDPLVTRLSVDIARIIPMSALGWGFWSLETDAHRGVETLHPLLEVAQRHGVTVVLEPSDYRTALLAPELILGVLKLPEFTRLRLGTLLPVELPESHDAAERLIARSQSRVAVDGQPLELTVGVAGIVGREQVESLRSGLAVPALESAEAVQAQLLRLARLVLAAGDDVRTVIATEDPMLLATATLLADQHGVELTVQLRAGVAEALADALVQHGTAVLTRIPLVTPKELAGAVGPLIRLAVEAADPASSVARAARMRIDIADAEAPGAELARILDLADRPFPASHRQQLRGREWDPEEADSGFYYRPPAETERLDTGGLTAAVLGLGRDATGQLMVDVEAPVRRVPVVSESGFANEPDTDASRAANREWARRALTRAGLLRASWGVEAETGGIEVAHSEALDRDALLRAAGPVADAWQAQRPSERAARIARLALSTASARDRLLAVVSAETGAPVAAIDTEISGAIDAARYLGQLASGLGAVRGAEFQPDRLTLVVADRGAGLTKRAEAMLAALAAGSAVVLVAHETVARSSAALIEEWEAAGLPFGMATLAVAPESGDVPASQVEAPRDPHAELAAAVAADQLVDRAIVLGNRETARALIRRRPDLRIEGQLRSLGSTLIAPSADLPVAVRSAVRSAFGGLACGRAARALVLMGSAARSKRVRRLLEDAVNGLRVGDTAAPGGLDPLSFEVGPLCAPPGEAGRRALTQLDPGESWLVEPEQLDDEGRLWRPGVRLGVRKDARFWDDAIGMPVMGVIGAGSLAEAIMLQNRLGGGSVAALHATDEGEILPWLDGVRAASLSVGRATTDARVERQPWGGWGAAGMGAQPLAAGPNRLFAFGTWRLREGTPSSTLHLRGLDLPIQALIETAQAALDYPAFDRVRRAALSDALTWRTTLGRVRDAIGLGVDRNVLRHWPVSTHVRLAESGTLAELLRVLAAGLLVGSPLSVSTGQVLPAEVSRFLELHGVPVSLEHDDAWLERMAVLGAEGARAGAGVGVVAERVRLIGGDRVRTAEWLGGQDRVPLWADPVTMAGPVELLVFLREQSIAVVANRYGLISPLAAVEDRLAELDARVVLGEAR